MQIKLEKPPFGKMLRRLMKDGFTQGQIEEETGLSQSFISNITRGRRGSMQYDRGARLVSMYAKHVLKKQVVFAPINGGHDKS